MRVVALPSHEPCSFELRHLDRHMQMWLEAPPGTEKLRFSGPLGTFEVLVGEPAISPFRDCRVIFTLSRDNELDWIRDWVRFNRDVHGADAVLLYDNRSTLYTRGRIAGGAAID